MLSIITCNTIVIITVLFLLLPRLAAAVLVVVACGRGGNAVDGVGVVLTAAGKTTEQKKPLS